MESGAPADSAESRRYPGGPRPFCGMLWVGVTVGIHGIVRNCCGISAARCQTLGSDQSGMDSPCLGRPAIQGFHPAVSARPGVDFAADDGGWCSAGYDFGKASRAGQPVRTDQWHGNVMLAAAPSGSPAQHGQKHAIRPVPMRPQLHRRSSPEVRNPGEQGSGVDQLQAGRAAADHTGGLGEVR